MERKQHLHSSFRGDGAALQRLFDPRFVLSDTYTSESLEGVSSDYLSGLVSEVRKHLYTECQKGCCMDEIQNNKGRYEIEGKAAQALRRTGGAIASSLAHPDVIQLPQHKKERQAFSRVLIDSVLHNDSRHRIIAPVCPDYGKNEEFYRKMGGGISPEAQAAINAAKVLNAEYKDFMTPEITILVADTEDDIEEIMQNTSRGERTVYKAKCESSVQAIQEVVTEVEGVEVKTFSQYLGEDFRKLQKLGEDKIMEVMLENDSVYDTVASVAEQRIARHSQILARPEQSYELTIRYMAQYMALGEIARNQEVPTILLNYQTPNRAFYNASAHIHHDLRYTPELPLVVPVLGTFAKR